jgi:hypothetical protein
MKQGPTARSCPVPFRPGSPSCWLCHAGLCLAGRRRIAHECFSRISSFISSGAQWQTLQQWGRFRLSVAQKHQTCGTRGLGIPSTLLARADEVIELRSNVRFWHSGNERMRPLGPLGRICPSGRRPDVAIIRSGAYRSHGDRSNGVRGDD